jgi:hypothetical protein
VSALTDLAVRDDNIGMRGHPLSTTRTVPQYPVERVLAARLHVIVKIVPVVTDPLNLTEKVSPTWSVSAEA